MRKVGALGLVVVMALCFAIAGCRSSARPKEFTGEFQVVALQDAPAEIGAHYERMKAIPGLTVLEKGGNTYLLLAAGRVDQSGLAVEVLSVQVPAKGTRGPVRIIARLMPGGEPHVYPYTVLVLDGVSNLEFQARVATRSETVLDLTGLPLVER